MESKLYLGGGGDKEQSELLDAEFTLHLEELGEKPECLYIPVAMDVDKHNDALEWFTDGYSSMFSDITMLRDLSEAKDLQNQYPVVYIGGGNTGRLLDQIYANDFDSYLADHLSRGGVIYGGSAGAIVLGASILTTPEFEHSAISNEGLDLLAGRSVVAHYKGNTDRNYVQSMSSKLNTQLLAIPEDAGVIVDNDGNLTAVGAGVIEFNSHGSVNFLS